jgi:hypothetical protein
MHGGLFLSQVEKRNCSVPCPECGVKYWSSGLHNHRGSKTCEYNRRVGPMIYEAGRTAAYMKLCGKLPITTAFALACKRRNFADMIGLEIAKTQYVKIFPNDDGFLEEEYWAYAWASKMYDTLSNSYIQPNPTYKELEKVHKLSGEQREAAINLLMLSYTDM